jgi:glucose uptake protein GlcU
MSDKIFNQHWSLQVLAGFAAWGITNLILDFDHGKVTLVLVVSLSIYIVILSIFFLIQKLRKRDRQPN